MNQSVNYSQALGSLTKDQAHDLVFRLNDDERSILMKALEQFNVKQEKDGLISKCFVVGSLTNLMNVCTQTRRLPQTLSNFP